MKILHFGSLSPHAGGPAMSTASSIRGIKALGHIAEIVCSAPYQEESVDKTILLHKVRFSPYHPFLTQRALQQLGEFDLYHIQGCWLYGGHVLSAFARKTRKPYVITLRGMLYPQALAKSALKKHLAMLFYQANDLEHAACIQATCQEEAIFYHNLGFHNPVAIIPNAIELPEELPPAVQPKNIFRIGYLGRLHPRKNVERLLYVLADPQMQQTKSELLIIGSGDQQYEAFLRSEVMRLHLDNVRFAGFLQGKSKREALRSLSVLVVPSDFENFGNIVPECLEQGVPVVASRGMPWQELETFHCGRWCQNDVKKLTQVLAEIQQLFPEEREEMGRRGQKLLQERYALPKIAKEIEHMYQWVLGQAEKPDFIVTC